MSNKYGNLDKLMDDASAVPPEMTALKPPSRFALAREALNHQPNMPPLDAVQKGDSVPEGIKNADENSEYEVVPPHLIDENPYNARHIYDPEAIANLALSMAADGQLQPGIATIRNGRYVLMGGHYRFKGLKKANQPTMKLVVRKEISDRDLYRLSFKENEERHPQTVIDNAYAWQKLLEQKVFEQASDIADAIGVSEGQVSKTLAILKMAPEIIEFASRNPENMGISILYELHQLEKSTTPEVALTMAKNISEGTATRSDISELRVKMTSQKKRKEHVTSRKYQLRGTSKVIGTMKESTDGRITLDLKIDNETERAALVKKLKEQFKVN